MQQTISFNDEEQAVLRDLTHVLGIPEEHVMRLALRRLAMAEGVVKHPAAKSADVAKTDRRDQTRQGSAGLAESEAYPDSGRHLTAADEPERRLRYGQRLKAARLAMGYNNAADFCRAVNKAAGIPNPSATEGLMTSQRLNNYERGRASPRGSDALLPILHGMGITIDYLITGNVACLPSEVRAATISHLRAIRAAESP